MLLLSVIIALIIHTPVTSPLPIFAYVAAPQHFGDLSWYPNAGATHHMHLIFTISTFKPMPILALNKSMLAMANVWVFITLVLSIYLAIINSSWITYYMSLTSQKNFFLFTNSLMIIMFILNFTLIIFMSRIQPWGQFCCMGKSCSSFFLFPLYF